jgi:hypothetical protein
MAAQCSQNLQPLYVIKKKVVCWWKCIRFYYNVFQHLAPSCSDCGLYTQDRELMVWRWPAKTRHAKQVKCKSDVYWGEWGNFGGGGGGVGKKMKTEGAEIWGNYNARKMLLLKWRYVPVRTLAIVFGPTQILKSVNIYSFMFRFIFPSYTNWTPKPCSGRKRFTLSRYLELFYSRESNPEHTGTQAVPLCWSCLRHPSCGLVNLLLPVLLFPGKNSASVWR